MRAVNLKLAPAMSHASVSRLGLAVRSVKAGKQKDLGSIPLLLFSLFKSCGL